MRSKEASEEKLRSSIQSSHRSATKSSAPLILCRIETHPETGKRISKSSAWRLRYFGLTFLTAAGDMALGLYPCGAAVESAGSPLTSGVFPMAKAPVRVAVTGAAGQIGYALLFRI